MRAAEAFFSQLIDYAGLFPPASLDLPSALAEYRTLQSHPRAWMLGRFVMPASLLHHPLVVAGPPKPIAVVTTEAAPPELIPEVDTLECKVPLTGIPDGVRIFDEVDWRTDYDMRIAAAPGGVKLRTGGLTAETVPPADRVAEFLLVAAAENKPVKFTAGLHVPVPNDDPVAGARVHGFLNVIAAAFVAYRDRPGIHVLSELIAQASYDDFLFTDDAFIARGFSFQVEEIERLRAEKVFSFGSCSFLEPILHLERHGLLT